MDNLDEDSLVFSVTYENYIKNIKQDKQNKTLGQWLIKDDKINTLKYAYVYLVGSNQMIVKKYNIEKFEKSDPSKGYSDPDKKCFIFILWNSISLCSYNYFYFKSTHMGLAGVGGVLVTTLNPILTSLFVFSFLDRSSAKLKELVGLIMGLTGGGIIMRLWEMDIALMISSGNIFYILASCSWVSVTIASQKSKTHIHFLTFSFWSFLSASLFSLSFCEIESISQTINYDSIYWLNIFLLSIVVMSFANTMYFFASSKIGAVKASSYIFVVPLTAIIFSKIILNEQAHLLTSSY